MHRIEWEFRPSPEHLEEFLATYGAEGAWVSLFRRSAGFLATQLLPVAGRPGWYRTIDHWRAPEDHAAFLAAFDEEYRALDKQCERLTLEERRVNDRPPLTPFHLAIPVGELRAARTFYGGLLGCAEGRSSDAWVDFDFFGHQLVCHLDKAAAARPVVTSNPVDGHDVPVPHFGIVLEMPDWEALADRLKLADVRFVIEPQIRFAGQAGEQATMFLLDPSGNALEFKAFRDIAGQLFAT
jgi:extradiol dioxygenase family protein